MWVYFVMIPFIVDLSTLVNAQKEFNYDDPYTWVELNIKCRGYRQSPISINAYKAILSEIPPIYFGFYNEPLKETLSLCNNGHTVGFRVPKTASGQRPYIKGSLLNDEYVAESVHFHWGSSVHKGSEHEVNGQRYDVEMHIVHKNVKYRSKDEACTHKDGLAVLAVFFQKSSNAYCPEFSEIYDALDQLTDFGSTANTKSIITLDSLLGTINTDKFFAYEGSLTTPPCSETVIWHVFPDVIPISPIDLSKFWSIQDYRGQPLLNNFRPLQNIADRDVYYQLTYEEHDEFNFIH